METLRRSVEKSAATSRKAHTGIWKRIEPLGCSCSRGFNVEKWTTLLLSFQRDSRRSTAVNKKEVKNILLLKRCVGGIEKCQVTQNVAAAGCEMDSLALFGPLQQCCRKR